MRSCRDSSTDAGSAIKASGGIGRIVSDLVCGGGSSTTVEGGTRRETGAYIKNKVFVLSGLWLGRYGYFGAKGDNGRVGVV